MMIEQIRNLRDARPFRPFVLLLADGGRIPVADRELILVVPSGRIVVVCQSDDSFNIVDMSLVTSVEAKGSDA
jgi:hypothetical protein